MFSSLNPYISSALRRFFASVTEPGSGFPPRALLIPMINAWRFDVDGGSTSGTPNGCETSSARSTSTVHDPTSSAVACARARSTACRRSPASSVIAVSTNGRPGPRSASAIATSAMRHRRRRTRSRRCVRARWRLVACRARAQKHVREEPPRPPSHEPIACPLCLARANGVFRAKKKGARSGPLLNFVVDRVLGAARVPAAQEQSDTDGEDRETRARRCRASGGRTGLRRRDVDVHGHRESGQIETGDREARRVLPGAVRERSRRLRRCRGACRRPSPRS